MAPCRDVRVRIAAARAVLANMKDETAKARESVSQADAVIYLIKNQKVKIDADERTYLITAVQGVPFLSDDKLRIVALLAPLVSQ